MVRRALGGAGAALAIDERGRGNERVMENGRVSYWIDSTEPTSYPPLRDTIEVDVAVVGGGITGLTTAYLLAKEGRTVAVIDSKRIVRGVTGYTTAKLTAGHGVLYAELIERFGERRARIYAESNQRAVDRVREIASELGIDCDLEAMSNYVYGESPEDAERIRREVDAAQLLGLPASFVTETPLPYDVSGAIRLDDQAQFHPRKYLLPLAAAVEGAGGWVFEETMVVDVKDGSPSEVRTRTGSIRARDTVLASHIPFLDRGLFFAKVHPHRSYAVAARTDPSRIPEGMFLNAGTPTRSVRSIVQDGSRLLLVGGDGHKPGADPDTVRHYDTLERFAREFDPAAEVTHTWSTQDYMSVDRVPYMGRLTRRSRHVFVATGFGKWGMSNGTVAATILADLVLGRENDWLELYDAKRLELRASARRFVTENAKVAGHFVADRVSPPGPRAPEELQPGEGAVVRRGGQLVAISRGDDGTLSAVSAACTHLGCIVAWNPAERSWDCPCHGSRFGADGKVIQGPAIDELAPREA
jgi:glycine/D-amino acid oxidase-like deaminating enzyme/nitrite reductase/ring-hydroxylating ferredoxin subunit